MVASWSASQPTMAVLLVLPSRSLQVTITNFSLSKLLVSEDELLRDQRGSLAYISPDVLSGEKEQMHACCNCRVEHSVPCE